MKYYVAYVQRCTPTLAVFPNKLKMDKFINEFEKSDDDWIDFWFKSNQLKVVDESVTFKRFR